MSVNPWGGTVQGTKSTAQLLQDQVGQHTVHIQDLQRCLMAVITALIVSFQQRGKATAQTWSL